MRILSFDWAFWFLWVMATTLGWLLGWLLLPGIALLAAGIGAGFMQWLILQQRISQPVRWFWSTAAGWGVGCLVVLFGLPAELDMFSGVILGLAVGTAQWIILRNDLQWTGWWVVFSIMAWTTGLHLLPGLLMTGISAGGLTGLALEILMRNPKPAGH